jgi:ABC-2 type transport system ATP-binding protein
MVESDTTTQAATEESTHTRQTPGTEEPALKAQHLCFDYGRRLALIDVGFTVRRSELFAFLGPNGSGKSTLFRLLSTLVPLQVGRVTMLGHNLETEAFALRRKLGVVFQHPSIDNQLTVAENLLYHGRLYGLSANELKSKAAGMLELFELGGRAGELASTLSGGLARRLELAKALLHGPELLLLDEPTTGLDPAARRDFLAHLERLRSTQQVTVVLTTHHTDEAERCDRVAVLDRGRLVAVATPAELKSQVGGEVLVLAASDAALLQHKIKLEFRVPAVAVDGTVRIEHPRAHELVTRLMESLGGQIEGISLGKPTLEDAFVHLTGHRLSVGRGGGEQG